MKYLLGAIIIALLIYACNDEENQNPSSFDLTNSTTPNYQNLRDTLLPYLTGYVETLDSNETITGINSINFVHNADTTFFAVDYEMNYSYSKKIILDINTSPNLATDIVRKGYRCFRILPDGFCNDGRCILHRWLDAIPSVLWCSCNTARGLPDNGCDVIPFYKHDLATTYNYNAGVVVLNVLNNIPASNIITVTTSSSKKSKFVTSLSSSTLDQMLADTVLMEILGKRNSTINPIDSITDRFVQIHLNNQKLFFVTFIRNDNTSERYICDITEATSESDASKTIKYICDSDGSTGCEGTSGTEIDGGVCTESVNHSQSGAGVTVAMSCICSGTDNSDGCAYIEDSWSWNYSNLANITTGEATMNDPSVFLANYYENSVSFNNE